MGYRNFKWYLLLRLALILLLSIGTMLIILETSMIFTPIALGFGLLLAIMELIYFANRKQRQVYSMLLSVKQGDFSSKKGKSKDPFYLAVKGIVDEMHELKVEAESQYRYLQTIVEHIAVGVLCFDESGEVSVVNDALKITFRMPYLSNVHQLKKIDPFLYEKILELQHGQKELFKIELAQETLNLSVQATVFKLQDETYKLVSLQNIKSELDEQELDAWEKLIRVLTHEISNSIMPIASLSKLINQILVDDRGRPRDPATLDAEEREDIRTSLTTIESRAQGMMQFVKSYRSMTLVPKPKLTNIPVKPLIDRIIELLEPDLNQLKIDVNIDPPNPEWSISADKDQVEQVLINLIVNARQALKEIDGHRLINIRLWQDERINYLMVSDNGPGIDPETLAQIFVPFYTTKKEGSGIGLSLSKQIMRHHHGRITVRSQSGSGSAFTLEFPRATS